MTASRRSDLLRDENNLMRRYGEHGEFIQNVSFPKLIGALNCMTVCKYRRFRSWDLSFVIVRPVPRNSATWRIRVLFLEPS